MACQMKTSIILVCCTLFLATCSTLREKPDLNQELLSHIKDQWSSVATDPKWFASDANFTSLDKEGNKEVHLFFDTTSTVNFSEKTLYFVVTTPAGSPASYDIDVVSGHRYKKNIFCEQNDVWGKYSKKIDKPPYTEGVVPRMLDQMGKPQKIVVFGNEDYYQEVSQKASHQVRVVGGVVEQVCHSANCIGRNNWDSRMVLIAVDMHDENMKEVVDIDGLKDKVNWEYAKAFMQNGQGRNRFGESEKPAFRVTGEIKPGFALKFTTSFSHIFEWEELEKIRNSCTKLYTYVWNNFGQMKNQEKDVETIADLNQKIKAQLDKKNKTFGSEFRKFHNKYGKDFSTCTDFVKSSTINENPEKHWFFAMLTGFYKLERLGYIWSCNQRTWQDNPFISNTNKRERNSAADIMNCSDEEIDMAFNQLSVFLAGLKNSGREYFRYIEYDNSYHGTHEKLYSWVNVVGKTLACDDSKLSKVNVIEYAFPDDIRWINRSHLNDKKKFGIIY